MLDIQIIAGQVSKGFVGLKLSAFEMKNSSAIEFYASFEGLRKEFSVSSVLTEEAMIRISVHKIKKLYPEIKMTDHSEVDQTSTKTGEKTHGNNK